MSNWTDEKHKAARSRWEAATQGPWESWGGTIEGGPTSGCDVVTTQVDCMSYCYGGMGRGVEKPEDREFITHAHTDIPELLDEIERLREVATSGEASDGYHTHNELYHYRMLYNAHAARGWLAQGLPVVKSWRHADGELCFGGGWFIVTATLPTGQVSNHYEEKYWDLFDVPEVVLPPEWDGHTPEDAADRLEAALKTGESPDA